LSENPHFAKSVLARWTPEDTEAWIAGAGIAYHEKKLGQLFCDRSAADVVDFIDRELHSAGVLLRLGVQINDVARVDGGFLLKTSQGEFQAPHLVVATGGLSYTALGASGFGLELAENWGLPMVKTAPALDGFVFSGADAERFEGLQGLAIDAKLTAGGKSFSEAILFTHKGLSGPAALQASLYWRPGQYVEADLLPGKDAAEDLLEYKRGHPLHYPIHWLATYWPQRLAERWQTLNLPQVDDLGRMSDKALRAFAATLQPWSFMPGGTVGYHKAEVTRGGVSTEALSQKDLQAKQVPGLYFCGEVVDVTGQLGGFNFQWAWASGAAVGRAI
jgi:predicted Rossmann fold flavoprotein